MHKKLAIVVLSITLILLATMPGVYATESILYQHTTDFYQYLNIGPDIGHGVGAGNIHGNGQYLTRVQVYLKNTTSAEGETGSIKMACVNESSSPRSIANAIELSNNDYDVSEITAGGWYEFTFDGTSKIMSDSEVEFIVYALDALSAPVSLAKSLEGSASKVSYVDGVYASAASEQSPWIIVYVSDVALGSPPDPEDPNFGEGEYATDYSQLVDNAVEFLVPVIVVLLPVGLLVFLFKRTDKWLILIGLALGVGLGYYFFGLPVWLVFLMAVGLIGMAYSEVRRNG